ncbi:MAG: carboxylesterase family protein [Chloroflexi bacterium]|nr:carboxylesterase family protein [Chloroflexota bacterium]
MTHVFLRPRWSLMVVLGVAALLNMLALPACSSNQGQGQQEPIVRTSQGQLRGATSTTAEKFLGIPYAAPPVGQLRWQAPAPPSAWQGVRDATRQQSACPQLSSTNGPTSTVEDCLYLNVYRPLHLSTSARLPVFFWIHGGGFTNGTGNQFDGSAFSAHNNEIVVTINYRLNVFGFLALPALISKFPAVGDIGLLDQQAALRWTQLNIAAFGGDPRAVTIAGESAGGWSVCDQLASPTASGLFHGAIIESGSCVQSTQEQAESKATDFANAVGCTDAATVVTCLDSKSSSELIQASTSFMSLPYPGVDVLPQQPYQAITSGHWNRVPVLLGNNHDEASIFFASMSDLTTEGYRQLFARFFGKLAPQVQAQYPLNAYAQPFDAFTAAAGDAGELLGACVTQVNAGMFQRADTPTYEYQFDARDEPAPQTIVPPLGAYHSGELQFIWPGYFGDYNRGLNTSEQQLSSEMIK